ncbi:LysR family transcriptional regulator [Naasia lichenicola]|uniref:LysR family transcriptional regulator n=2 Tax=Naasia lichenicola TaxID=2565933 RepID=A0A4V3WTV8_9MICO|nr:LysR family transcriptional regulator [Naasia lichenicola]
MSEAAGIDADDDPRDDPRADPQTLRWFIAVTESPSFSKAAAELGIARQKLSAAMLALESGPALFDREVGGTALTEAGRALLGAARIRVAEAEAQAAASAAEAVEHAQALETAPFPITLVAGVTVSKWTTRWDERNPAHPVAVMLVDDAAQAHAVRDGTAACAFVRLPIVAGGTRDSEVRLHSIPLYSEDSVVIAAKGHLIEAADVLELTDLVDERLLSPPQSLPGWSEIAKNPGTPEQRDQLLGLTPAQLIEVVATGAGIAVLPASIVRTFGRKDVIARPLTGAPQSTVAIAWRADDDSRETEQFVGIVRGRTERSSRAEPTPPTERKKAPAVRQRSASSHAARRKRR